MTIANIPMIFDQMTGALYSSDGSFVKTVRCPLALRAEQLEQPKHGSPDRYCNWCNKTIIGIDELSEEDILKNIESDKSFCIFATSRAKNIIFLQSIGRNKNNYSNLPIIKTVRSLEGMVDSLERGYLLVFKNISETIKHGEEKYIVYQNQLTGKLWWSGDYRVEHPTYNNEKSNMNDWKLIRDWFFVRSDRPFPLAAYAIPPDLCVGAKVFLEDLIEDLFEEFWNQGNALRRVSSPATWNGKDLKVDPPDDFMMMG